MRSPALLIVLVLSSHLSFADEGKKPSVAETELGQSLTEAIAKKDIAAYSQCWLSWRHAVRAMKEGGVEIPPEQLGKFKTYYGTRNQIVAESFDQLQEFIDKHKVDRKSLKFIRCKAENVREEMGVKVAAGFVVELSAGREKWRYLIDDGMMVDGLWYFTDTPTNLFTGKKIIGFRDHRFPSDEKQ